MEYRYTEEELHKLQETLYLILAEIKRVCDKHGLHYFITGGTAIGAHFWGDLIPWDDDIDVGMPRPDYERFQQIAPKELSPDFFLQTPLTDPHVPFFFIKVRMNDTEFCESTFAHISMHQGIFVDIFPFDKIPDKPWQELLQHKILYFLNGLFIAKEIWQWTHCGHCHVENPRPRGFLPCLGTRVLVTLLPKSLIFRMMLCTQTFFNHRKDLKMCKNIITASERVPIDDVIHPQTVRLGSLQVSAARDLLTYLLNHYGHVQKEVPEEMKTNHRPARLKFKETKDK